MPRIGLVFASGLNDFFDSGTWQVIRNLALLFVVMFWAATAYWVYKDARRRIEDPWLVGMATLLGAVVPFVGPLIYMLFRPPEYLEDVRERELEIKATERTLVLVKPDAMQRGLAGEIIARLERRGLLLRGADLVHVDRDLAEQHYAEHREKPFYEELVAFITSSPTLALAVEGEGAIALVRATMGATNPANAAPGTIRGDLALSMPDNLVHGSDSPESAARELAIWCDPAAWVPEAARLLRVGGKLVFLRNSTLAILCSPDEGRVEERLVRPQFGMRRLEWDGGVEFHPGHGDWIALLRGAGFEVERLGGLQAPPGAADHPYYDFVGAGWARRWPAEEIWVARKR